MDNISCDERVFDRCLETVGDLIGHKHSSARCASPVGVVMEILTACRVVDFRPTEEQRIALIGKIFQVDGKSRDELLCEAHDQGLINDTEWESLEGVDKSALDERSFPPWRVHQYMGP